MKMELPVIPAPNLSAPAKVGSTGTSTSVQSSVSFILTYMLVTQYASSKSEQCVTLFLLAMSASERSAAQ